MRDPKTPFWIRLAVACCVGQALTALGQSTPPAKVDLPAIKVGDTWTLDLKDAAKNEKLYTSVLTATAIGDGKIRIESKRADNGQVSALTQTTELNLIESDIAAGKSAYVPYYGSFAFPLEVGKTWEQENTYTRSYENGRKVVAKLRGKVLGWEKVTVPAGTFDAMKIELRSQYNGENMRGRWFGQSTETIWYAPAVRYYVKWSLEDGGGDGTHRTSELTELTAYKLVQ